MTHRSSAKYTIALVGGLLATPVLAQSYPTIRNDKPAAATLSHWTDEAMAAAKPMDLPLAGTGHRMSAAAVPAAPGAPGAAGGTEHVPLPQSALDELTYGVPQPADGSYPGPHTTFGRYPGSANVPYLNFPYAAVGRLFFTEPGVGDFVCSASATYGGSALNIVWTAGHCVANGGHQQFYTSWMYCPGWKNGVNGNFGCWAWTAASTTGGWFNQGAFTRDEAVVAMQHTGTVLAEDVVSATGGFGFAWNWSRDQNWVHYGYPTAAPYDGAYQIVTNTEHRYDDVPDAVGPPANSFGSPQTPGSSGSPVLLFWSQSGGYINSNISYYYGPQLGHELQGPYYDTNTCGFWKSWTGYSGTC
jgi:V8-like Glu-specific endopeptidase